MGVTRRHILAGSAAAAALGVFSPPVVKPVRADGHVKTFSDSAVRAWRDYVAGGWGQVHLWLAEPAPGPGDKTPLVCLHQSPTSGAYYKEFQAVMAEDRLVISPDTPGYGGSTAPDFIPSMAEYGAAMVEAMTNLGYGPGNPIDILGFHTGNFIAIEMALQSPGLIRKMVMPGIPYFAPEERPARRDMYANPRPYFTDPAYFRDLYARNVFNNDNGMAKDRQLEMFTERLRAGVKSHFGFVSVFEYEPEDKFAALTQPVLLPILNETLAQPTRTAGQMIPNATVVEMPEQTAMAWFTEPGAIAAVARPWLDGAA